jgi:hypothetical protein
MISGHLIRSIATAFAVCSTAALPGSLLVSSSTHRSEAARNPATDVTELVARSVCAASARNEAALADCTSAIREILDREFAKLHEAAGPAAKSVATFRTCLRLIALLASDKVRGRSDANNLVRRRINDWLDPDIDNCHRQIQDAIDTFDRELAASTLTLATELAGIGATAATSPTLGHQPGLGRLSLNEALVFLGFESVTLPPAIAIDVYDLIHNRLMRWLINNTTNTAKWIFARPIAAATAEAACVVIDGPLPIGDVIGLAGALWTARDVYRLRPRFKQKLVTAIREGLSQSRIQIKKDALNALQDRVVSHAAIQARIHDETVRSFLKRTH